MPPVQLSNSSVLAFSLRSGDCCTSSPPSPSVEKDSPMDAHNNAADLMAAMVVTPGERVPEQQVRIDEKGRGVCTKVNL